MALEAGLAGGTGALGTHLDRLVTAVESQWAVSGFAREAFPDIAQRALEEAALHGHADLDAWLAWLAAQPGFPRQVDPLNTFGSPPITLAFRERFALDLYFWLRPEVDIHNHSFDGAFAVLVGVSLHSTYAMEIAGDSQAPLLTGPIRCGGIELLQRGDVRPIQAGRSFIHQVAHLSVPCLSLVLRTHPSLDDPPIYTFMPPSAALLQRRYLNESEQKQLALIPLLFQLRGDAGLRQVGSLLRAGSDLLVAWGLRTAAQATQDMSRVAELARAVADRPWVAAFVEAIATTDSVDADWSILTAESHRLVAVLAKAAPDRRWRDAVARVYRPGHTFTDLAVAVAREMSQLGLFGVSLPDFTFVLLRGLIDGLDDAATVETLVSQLGGQRPAGLEASVAQTRMFFAGLPIFRRLVPSRV